jgi:hypothetical protein
MCGDPAAISVLKTGRKFMPPTDEKTDAEDKIKELMSGLRRAIKRT